MEPRKPAICYRSLAGNFLTPKQPTGSGTLPREGCFLLAVWGCPLWSIKSLNGQAPVQADSASPRQASCPLSWPRLRGLGSATMPSRAAPRSCAVASRLLCGRSASTDALSYISLQAAYELAAVGNRGWHTGASELLLSYIRRAGRDTVYIHGYISGAASGNQEGAVPVRLLALPPDQQHVRAWSPASLPPLDQAKARTHQIKLPHALRCMEGSPERRPGCCCWSRARVPDMQQCPRSPPFHDLAN